MLGTKEVLRSKGGIYGDSVCEWAFHDVWEGSLEEVLRTRDKATSRRSKLKKG